MTLTLVKTLYPRGGRTALSCQPSAVSSEPRHPPRSHSLHPVKERTGNAGALQANWIFHDRFKRPSLMPPSPLAVTALPLSGHHKPSAYGGGERDRTDDLLLAKQALSQLSYTPAPDDRCRSSDIRKAKTAAPPLHSDLISVSDLWRWWAREDLNLRPHAYQARALTS